MMNLKSSQLFQNEYFNSLRQRISSFFSKDKKLKILVIAGLAGVLLLLVTEYAPKSENKTKSEDTETEQSSFSQYEIRAEERLESILSKIEGIGSLSVMVTLENSGKKVYTADEESSYSAQDSNTSSDSSRKYVLIDGSDGDEGLESESITPNVRGVIVVCEGADNSIVRENVISAVSAAFNISTSNISVVKGENRDG